MSNHSIVVDENDDIQLDTSEDTVNTSVARQFGMEEVSRENSATLTYDELREQFDSDEIETLFGDLPHESDLTEDDNIVKSELERIFEFSTVPIYRKDLDYTIDLYIENILHRAQNTLQMYPYYRPLMVKMCDFKIAYKSTAHATEYGLGLFIEREVENSPLEEREGDALSGKHFWILVEQVTNTYIQKICKIVYTWLLINIVPHSNAYKEERQAFSQLVRRVIWDNGLDRYTDNLDAVVEELLDNVKWMVVFIASTYNTRYDDIYRKLIIF